jgi:DNA-binding XRE family transcriptional regulator
MAFWLEFGLRPARQAGQYRRRRAAVTATVPTLSRRFASNLQRLREAAHLNQEELAFRADIHRTQISFIESGKRMPRLDTLMKLAGALGVPVGDLVAGIIWTPSEHRRGGFTVTPEEDVGDGHQ